MLASEIWNVLPFCGSRGEPNLELHGTLEKLATTHTTDREPVVAIVVVLRVNCRRIDVQIVHIVTIVASRRPEVAVRALIVGCAAVEVARERST